MRSNVLVLSVLAALIACPIEAQERMGGKGKAIEIAWAVQETAHFRIEFENSVSQDTIARVGAELEDILVQYQRIFRVRPPKDPKFRVRMLEGINTFEQVSGNSRMAGFYSPSERTLYLRQLPFYELIPVVYHEAFHQYIHMFVGDEVAIPLWFNEGMAEYYENMKREAGSKKLSPKLIETGPLKMTKERVKTRSQLPLLDLINADHERFHDKEKEALHYGQSFALVYYFMQTTGGKAMLRYAKSLKSSKSVDAANAKLFGKDFKKLPEIEARWQHHMRSLPTGK